jgi:hypothetical protein
MDHEGEKRRLVSLGRRLWGSVSSFEAERVSGDDMLIDVRMDELSIRR